VEAGYFARINEPKIAILLSIAILFSKMEPLDIMPVSHLWLSLGVTAKRSLTHLKGGT